MWVSQGETEVINKPEYHFAVEEFRSGADQMLFLHLTVHKHTPSVFKEIIKNWKLFRECVTCPVYGYTILNDTAKWEKFVSRLGFQFLTDVICQNGAHRRLFVHFKEKENDGQQFKPNRPDQQQHAALVSSAAVPNASILGGVERA